MVRSRTVAAPTCLFTVIVVVDELKIDVVVLGLSANTEAPSLDTRENDANELAKRRRIQGDNAISTAALCVLGVDAVAWDRCLRDTTDGL
jgi:hypothetical protein